MKNEFILYEQATALKELGFDEECIAFYKENSHLKSVDQHWGMSICGISKKLGYEIDDLILAPTYSRVFRWIRENYDIHCELFNNPEAIQPWSFSFYTISMRGRNTNVYHGFNIYEEAKLECLKKLIEIISTKRLKTNDDNKNN